MLMTEPQVEKKFEARIPMALWEEYECWLEDRGTVSNGTLLSRLLRCFLDLAEPTQLQILFGKRLPVLMDPDYPYTGNQDDQRPVKTRLDLVRQLIRGLPSETIRLLTPEESREIDELRFLLGPLTPEAPATAKPKKEKRA